MVNKKKEIKVTTKKKEVKKSTKKKISIKKGGNDFPFKMPELLVLSDNNKEFQGLKQMSKLTELAKSMKNLQGSQGSQGTQGTQGSQGSQGLQGLKDLQGLQGLKDLQGLQGLKDLQGLQGLKDLQGLQGLKDLQGLQDLSKLSNISKVGGKKPFTKKPITTKKPSTTKKSITTKKSSTTKKPITTKKSSTTKKLITTKKPTTTKKTFKKIILCKKGGNNILQKYESNIILRSELFDNSKNNKILNNLGFKQKEENKKNYTYKNYKGNEKKYESKNPYKYLKIKKKSLKFIGGGSFASFYKLTLQKYIFSSKKIIGLRVFQDEEQEILSSPIQYYLQRQSSNNNECKNSVCKIIDYGKINEDYLYTMLELGIFTLTNFYNILYINDKNYKEKILLLHFEIIITILKKIKCIHKQKILHLDIKPDNIVIFDGTKDDYDIMIDENLYNNVFKKDAYKNSYYCSQYIIIKFIDFGIAKVMKKYNRYIIEKKLFQKSKYKLKDYEEMVLLKKIPGTLEFMPQIN